MIRVVKTILIVLGCLALILGGFYVYFFELGGLEKFANSQIAPYLSDKYDLDVRIGKITGNLFSGLILEGVSVFYDDSLQSYLIAYCPSISSRYALSNLWRRNFKLEYLYLDSAQITLTRDSTGRWLLPNLESTKGESDQIYSPQFSIGILNLNNVSVKILDGHDTLDFKNIELSLALQGLDDTYAININRFEFSSSDKRLMLDAAGGKLTYSDGRLLFKDLALLSGNTRIKLDGYTEFGTTPTGQVDFAIDNINLREVTDFIGPRLKGILDLNGKLTFEGSHLAGTVDMGGNFMFASFENLFASFRYANKHLLIDTLYGMALGGCAIDGSGDIDFSTKPGTYRLMADIRNFNLKNLVKNSHASNLNGRINLKGKSFRRETFLLDIYTELFESSFYNYHFHEAFGNLIITIDTLFFVDPFCIKYHENTFHTSGWIDYNEQTELHITADLANLDRYREKLFLKEPGGRGHAEAVISGKTIDPDLKGYLISDSLWLYDLYSKDFRADFDIKRFLTGKKGHVEVNFLDGAAWDLPYDTGYSCLTTDSNLIFIDTAFMNNLYISLNGRGLLDYQTYPMQLDIDSLTLLVFDVDFYNRGKLNIEIDSTGFDFKQSVIGDNDALIAGVGRINYDESLDILLEANQVPATPWVSLFDRELSLDGRVSCQIGLRGTFDKPQIELNGNVDSLIYRDLVLGDLSISTRYRDRLLTIDSVKVLSRRGTYHADGFVHMDLALSTTVKDRFPELPMEISIKASDHRFDLVSLLLPSVEQLDGELSADFNIAGTPNAPLLEGTAFIKNARLKYFDLEDPIHADSASITMRNNLILIDNVEAYTHDRKKGNRKRYAYLDGEIIVKSLDNLYYDVDVLLPREFPFSYELEDIRGRVEGDLHIEGSNPPLVTGDLILISMSYLVEFAEIDEGSPIMSALSGENLWDLNLNVDVLSNYWVKNETINAEFAGQLNIIRENGIYQFIGEMEVLRGRGFLFDKTFRIESGGRVIFEGDKNLNARLDLTGFTRIAAVNLSAIEDEESTQEQIELGIHVTGTLEIPEINPVEGSDLARDDIIPLIVANYYSSDTVSASGRLEERISGVIGTQISQIGTRQLNQLGVETFEIDPYYQGQFDPLMARVTVGFYTASKLYVYGRSALSLRSGQEVGFEYRFNRNLLVDGRMDEDQLYRLSLKLHWEF